MSGIINRLSRCVAKIAIEKPIRTNTEYDILKSLNKIRPYRLQGIIVIINTFGGSLISAKNIANSLCKIRDDKQIPIFCFAEDFCLNSANIVLTAGTYCYANKFSSLGDFGYVYENFDMKTWNQKHKIGKQYVSSTSDRIERSQEVFKHDENKIYEWLHTSEHDLRCSTIINRKAFLQRNNVSEHEFEKNIFHETGIVSASLAAKHGLIDGINSYQMVLKTHFKGIRLIEPQKNWKETLALKVIDKANPFSD